MNSRPVYKIKVQVKTHNTGNLLTLTVSPRKEVLFSVTYSQKCEFNK